MEMTYFLSWKRTHMQTVWLNKNSLWNRKILWVNPWPQWTSSNRYDRAVNVCREWHDFPYSALSL